MAISLVDARRALTGINTHLKQGNLLSAAQGLRDGVAAMLQSQLMKAERAEMVQMVQDGISHLGNNRDLIQLFPIKIEYVPGEEKDLLPLLDDLLETLRESTVGDAGDIAEDHEARWQNLLEEGQAALDADDIDNARKHFGLLLKEKLLDKDLRINIALRYMQAGHLEDAVVLLKLVTEGNGYSAAACNYLGIAFRRLKQFKNAEVAFEKALGLDDKDPNIYFNQGRLYLDWQKWPEAVSAAEKAVELDSSFTEAAKLVIYAKKKM